MITSGKLKEILSALDDKSEVSGYEGESTGISIRTPDGCFYFLYADDSIENQDYKQCPDVERLLTREV